MPITFADAFGVSVDSLDRYGAFNISLDSDLPVFIDPFLLFHSNKKEYRQLHKSIIDYLRFLRDRSKRAEMTEAELRYYYCFKEVKQNWLGFCILGNEGRALGMDFARSLHENLHTIFKDFGEEQVTRGSHLEKVGLIKSNVGRDSISDFTTNLIKQWLLSYTEKYAVANIDATLRRKLRVRKTKFNYTTEAWEDGEFELPWFQDFVILTPIDILTKDNSWINYDDMVRDFPSIPSAITDQELRTLVSNYFYQALDGRTAKKYQMAAAQVTIAQFPSIIDYYIRQKEDAGDTATTSSIKKVHEVESSFKTYVQQAVNELRASSNFYDFSTGSYEEALGRSKAFKQYIENQDGYQLLNNARLGFADEKGVQLAFGLIWFGTIFDVNIEPNNGRGPVDFKISRGDHDKSLVEFKLASNKKLKSNLENQLAIYEKANRTAKSVTVIVYFNAQQGERMTKILKELGMNDAEHVVTIDARSDNKPSASTVK